MLLYACFVYDLFYDFTCCHVWEINSINISLIRNLSKNKLFSVAVVDEVFGMIERAYIVTYNLRINSSSTNNNRTKDMKTTNRKNNKNSCNVSTLTDLFFGRQVVNISKSAHVGYLTRNQRNPMTMAYIPHRLLGCSDWKVWIIASKIKQSLLGSFENPSVLTEFIDLHRIQSDSLTCENSFVYEV